MRALHLAGHEEVLSTWLGHAKCTPPHDRPGGEGLAARLVPAMLMLRVFIQALHNVVYDTIDSYLGQ